MIKLIKDANVYSPQYIGKKDVMIIGDKIGAIGDDLSLEGLGCIDTEIIDGANKVLTPGFIDSHEHILGGGGEGGFKTRTPEVKLEDLIIAGVTTVVGCLGTDGIARDVLSLLAKARGLEEEGITSYIYTGSYHVPVVTITGEAMKDIIAIDKVIGIGEIAISDHRSSQPTVDEFKRLAADARVAGMLSGKAGIVNVHVGDGKGMLDLIWKVVKETEVPFTQILPTHTNRNPYLFKEAIKYAKEGGHIDFTTSSDPVFWEEGETKCSKALKICLDQGVDESRITFSSDGQGSMPIFNEKKETIGLKMGKAKSLYGEVKDAVLTDDVPLETAIKVITSNPADMLKLKNKGRIEKGLDADIVLLNEQDLSIDSVIAKGQVMMRDKDLKVFGTFKDS